MNPNTRTKRIEMLVNAAEETILDTVRGPVDRSSFMRGLMYAAAAARTHGMAAPPPRESRHCRGLGRPASRASVSMSQRRQV